MLVMIAEDSRCSRAIIRWLLEAGGFDVDEVARGADVVDRARDADVAVIDMVMPDVDGLTVLERLRTSTRRTVRSTSWT